MDPTDWQYTNQRQWESLNPRQWADSRENTENVPHCGYYSVNDNKRPHTMMAMANEELEHHNSSSHRHRSYKLNSNILNSEMVTSDPDSEPEELSKIDEELARKRRELQQIEKQILHKKTTDAMKTTGPLKAKTPSCQMFKDREEDRSHSKADSSVKNTPYIPFIGTGEKAAGFSSSKWSSTYNNRPLKERVNALQQRWCDGFLAKAFSTPSDHLPSPNPVEKTNTLNEDDHPLKVRVKALMNRHHHPGVLDSHGEVSVKPPPSCESPSTTVADSNLVVKGFQRFLSVLNKGVDIEMLTKIVNEDNELPPTGQKLLHSQPPVVKEREDVFKSESQQLRSGAVQRDPLYNGEGKRSFQPEEISTHSDDRCSSHFGSRRRSRSPDSPPKVEEKKPKLEQHQEELQNILKTIGFCLDADDMCKLAERTQERLFGIKHETKQELASAKVREKHQQNSFTSVSDNLRSSPPRHQRSSSKTFRDSGDQTQCSEYQHSRRRSGESRRAQERERDDNHTIVSRDSAPGHQLYPETTECLVPYPDAAPAFPTHHSDSGSAIPFPTYHSGAGSAIPTYHSDSGSAIPTYHSDAGSAIPMYHSEAGSVIPMHHSDSGSAIPMYHTYNSFAIPTYNSDTAFANPTYNSDGASAIPKYTSVEHLKQELDTVRKVIALVNRDRPANNSRTLVPCQPVPVERREKELSKKDKFLQELAGKEHNILKRLEQNIDMSLCEGQTGQQSDLCYPHAINTVQHSEHTTYHSDTSSGAFSTAWNYGADFIPPSSSYPPVFRNYSMPPLCPPPNTGALFGQDYPHPHMHPYPPAGCNTALGHSHFNTDLSLNKGQTGWPLPLIPRNKRINIIKENKKKLKQELERIKIRFNEEMRKNTQMSLKEELKLVMNSIARAKSGPVTNSKVKPKWIKRVDQKKILKKPDEGLAGQQAPAVSIKKATFREKRSVQGQQEVELPTEEGINENLMEKESPANKTDSHTTAATARQEDTAAPGENDLTVPGGESQKEDVIVDNGGVEGDGETGAATDEADEFLKEYRNREGKVLVRCVLCSYGDAWCILCATNCKKVAQCKLNHICGKKHMEAVRKFNANKLKGVAAGNEQRKPQEEVKVEEQLSTVTATQVCNAEAYVKQEEAEVLISKEPEEGKPGEEASRERGVDKSNSGQNEAQLC